MATPDFGGSGTKLSANGFDQLLRPKLKIIKLSNRHDEPEKDTSLDSVARVKYPLFKPTQQPTKLRPLRWGKRAEKRGSFKNRLNFLDNFNLIFKDN